MSLYETLLAHEEFKLDSEQKAACEDASPVVSVTAGAGAGKTRVLAMRYLRLLDGGVQPERILAITFTRKAAAEMRKRIEEGMRLVGGKWPFEAARLHEMPIGTIDAFCLRFLREHPGDAGPEAWGRVLDGELESIWMEEQAEDFLRSIEAGSAGDLKNALEGNPYKGGVYERSLAQRLVTGIQDRTCGRDSSFGLKGKSRESEETRSYREAMNRLLDSFERHMVTTRSSEGIYGYGDIQKAALQLARKLGETALSGVYKHILLDEAQDTSTEQLEFLQCFMRCGASLFCVGDFRQSIYAWRGADPGGFARFLEKIGARGHVFHVNYRSPEHIVNFLNAFADAAKLPQKEGPMRAGLREDSPRVEPLLAFDSQAPTAAAREKMEASWVAGRISQLKKEGVKYSDVAILVRKHRQMAPFEAALMARRIPFVVPGALGVFGRPETLDMQNAMAFLIEPEDSLALTGLLRSPLFGLSDDALVHLQLGKVAEGSLWTRLQAADEAFLATLMPEDAAVLLRAKKLLPEWREAARALGPSALLGKIYGDTHALAFYAQGPRGPGRHANLLYMLDAARRFEEEGLSGLPRFLRVLRRIGEGGDSRAEASMFAGAEAVHIMTVHGAKGLEFPMVFAAALPFKSNDEDGESEEEKRENLRIMYVAFSRARESLHLSGSLRKEEEEKWNSPSLQTLLEKSGAEASALLRLLDVPSYERFAEDAMEATGGPLAAFQNINLAPEAWRGGFRTLTLKRESKTPVLPRAMTFTQTARILSGEGKKDIPPSTTQRRTLTFHMSYGSLVHRLFEARFHDLEWETIASSIALWGKKESWSVEETAKAEADIRRLQDCLREHSLTERLRHAENLRHELPVVWRPHEGLVLRGAMDIVFKEDGALCVWDVKTGAATESGKAQVCLYAMALADLTEEKVKEASLLETGKEGPAFHHVPLDDENIQKLRDSLASLAAGQSS